MSHSCRVRVGVISHCGRVTDGTSVGVTSRSCRVKDGITGGVIILTVLE